MLELSRMQGCVAGSWVPLGLLLVCLHLPGMRLERRTLGPITPQELELREGVKAGEHTWSNGTFETPREVR
jgi:hypothetical protein